VANNNYPQITSVTSEALQAQIRALLPSQEGFGTDLMAQNVIVPIIDLTSAAEGSAVPSELTNAFAFGSITSFTTTNTTTALANTVGFWRITGTVTASSNSGGIRTANIQITDGLATKKVFGVQNEATSATFVATNPFDFVVWLAAGQTLQAQATVGATAVGSYRQIADSNGVFVNPSGFNPQ
jgi:hypothetical protein